MLDIRNKSNDEESMYVVAFQRRFHSDIKSGDAERNQVKAYRKWLPSGASSEYARHIGKTATGSPVIAAEYSM